MLDLHTTLRLPGGEALYLAMNSNQDTTAGRLDQAYSFYSSGHFSQAESLCLEVLDLQPANRAALLMLGMVYIALNRSDEAKIWLLKAYDIVPQNPQYLEQLANGLMRTGLHAQAADCWSIRHKLEPRNEVVLVNFGVCLSLQGKHLEAARALEDAISINPDNTDALVTLGTICQLQGLNAQAERHFNKILQLQPGHETASAKLGEILQLENRSEEAVGIYRTALAESPHSASLLYGLYGASFETQTIEKSVVLLEEAVRHDPGHFLSRTHLGMLLDRLGHAAQAKKHFDFVQTHTPEYVFNIESWYYARDHFGPGTKLFSLSNSGLAYAVKNANVDGLFMEFGVWQGRSINYIASCTDNIVNGFDSFEGIPDAWEGMPSGSYSTFNRLPEVNPNVRLHKGWFSDSLPVFVQAHPESIAFINIDCDTYVSTKTIFDILGDSIVSGTVIVFDEYFCFPNWQKHEYKAFSEYLSSSGHKYEYLFFNLRTRQAGVIIL